MALDDTGYLQILAQIPSKNDQHYDGNNTLLSNSNNIMVCDAKEVLLSLLRKMQKEETICVHMNAKNIVSITKFFFFWGGGNL